MAKRYGHKTLTADDAETLACMGGIVPTIPETQVNRLVNLVADLPVDERKAALDALRYLQDKKGTINHVDGLRLLLDVYVARGRTEARRHSDRISDRKRRTLIGARVSHKMADDCRRAAFDEGLSLNAWVTKVLYMGLGSNLAAVDRVGADDDDDPFSPRALFYGWNQVSYEDTKVR